MLTNDTEIEKIQLNSAWEEYDTIGKYPGI